MKKKRIVIGILVVIVLIAGGLFGLYKFRMAQHKLDLQQMQEAARVMDDVDTDSEAASPINFDEIRKSNKDIVAWIEVPGTSIDYPILQSAEDMEEDYYLDHNVDGSKGYPGSVYIQKINNADFNDSVTVVYGHNMKDGSMFASLHDFEDLKFFEKNTEFSVYTPDGTKKYRVIAATTYDDRLIPDYYQNFATEDDVLGFVGSVYLQTESMINHYALGNQVDGSMHYVVLSTCTKSDDVRWLVVGVLESDLQ